MTWSRGMSPMSQILFLRYRQRKHSNFFVLYCFQRWYIAHNSVTRYPILLGFASKCSIFELPESGLEISKLKIFDLFPLIVSQLLSYIAYTLTFRSTYIDLHQDLGTKQVQLGQYGTILKCGIYDYDSIDNGDEAKIAHKYM